MIVIFNEAAPEAKHVKQAAVVKKYFSKIVAEILYSGPNV